MSSISSQLLTMQNATNSAQYLESKKNMGSSTLSKDSFLRLMMAQLKNQDPLKPQDNTQMLQQQAAMSTVEELQNLNKTMTQTSSLSQASSMIGKQVTVHNPDDVEQKYTGTVTSAQVTKDGTAVEIDGVLFPMDLVDKIENPSAVTN